ncbi:hypothetical protein SAMN05216383_1339 [Prevotella sp. KH2C16]|nr:hypothetical protein SAMN05216383_1339 [Prevotella sp. KH2C16]
MRFRNIIYAILLTALMSSCSLVISGSYPYAQAYECNVHVSTLVKLLAGLNGKNPSLEVWITNQSDSLEVINPADIYYYYCDFKVPIEKDSAVIMYCVINKNNEYPAVIRFDRTSPLDRSTFKKINTKDFTGEENGAMKRIFENKILQSLDIDWERSN